MDPPSPGHGQISAQPTSIQGSPRFCYSPQIPNQRRHPPLVPLPIPSQPPQIAAPTTSLPPRRTPPRRSISSSAPFSVPLLRLPPLGLSSSLWWAEGRRRVDDTVAVDLAHWLRRWQRGPGRSRRAQDAVPRAKKATTVDLPCGPSTPPVDLAPLLSSTEVLLESVQEKRSKQRLPAAGLGHDALPWLL